MKKSTLSQERLQQVVHYDPASGQFRWRRQQGLEERAGEIAGCSMRSDYWCIHIDGRGYRAHQLAWLYMTGEWGRPLIAHRDGDPFNNRWRNLRRASPCDEVSRRRPAASDNTRVAGIALDRFGLWTARVSTPERVYFLGRFATNEAAHEAYAVAARLLQADVCTT